MFKTIIYKVLEKRHFWRYASFSEIAELYMCRTIRVIAVSIVSSFTAVYMYESGYSLIFVMGFFACYYLAKIPLSFFAGHFIAKFGPKHGILISNLLYVPAMVALGLMPVFGVLSIVIWGLFMVLSTSIYQISYMVDFSKVKNLDHAGKELAFMNILEKIAIGMSPVIGGVIALYFGLQIVMWLSALLFLVSALPLFNSAEPVRLRQIIKFKGFPWRVTIRSLVAQTGVGFDFVTTGVAWSLFIAIVIFPRAGWELYVELGALSSVTILAAVAASYAYGKLIDSSRGGSLLKISTVANAVVHAFRPFASVPVAIVGINIANEAATMGYNMSFTRGVFDTADISGYRILYLCLCEAVASFGAALACLTLAALGLFIGNVHGLTVFFFIAAGFVLLIGTAKFDIYHK